jgi:hypothetical protein
VDPFSAVLDLSISTVCADRPSVTMRCTSTACGCTMHALVGCSVIVVAALYVEGRTSWLIRVCGNNFFVPVFARPPSIPHARGCNRRRASFAALQPRLQINGAMGLSVIAANRSRPIVLTTSVGRQLHFSMLRSLVPDTFWSLQPPPSLPKVRWHLLRTGLVQAGSSR